MFLSPMLHFPYLPVAVSSHLWDGEVVFPTTTPAKGSHILIFSEHDTLSEKGKFVDGIKLAIWRQETIQDCGSPVSLQMFTWGIRGLEFGEETWGRKQARSSVLCKQGGNSLWGSIMVLQMWSSAWGSLDFWPPELQDSMCGLHWGWHSSLTCRHLVKTLQGSVC